MSFVTTPSVVRQIGSLFDGGSVAGLTDRQLIERFNDRRDAIGEAAFAALVARHGAMVLHVCRQLLGDQHHAEDAFQAVFLVLARKARSIRDPDLLGNWLYGVALRTARKARVRIARRRKNEEGDAMRRPSSSPGVPAEQPVLAREQAEALYREIDRLPGPFRQTVVLCYFEGLTLEEAARRLRCPAGTVRSRLARACDKLRRGLTRRGVSLSGAALVAALSPRSASASVSSPLCDITTRAAMNFAAGQAAAGATSASAMALAQEVLRSMLLHKLKLTALTLLFLGSIATGAGYLTHSLAMKDEPLKVPAAPRPLIGARPIDVAQTPAPGRMFVTGRVLDPQGKPVPNATVMVNGRLKMSGRGDGFASLSPVPIGHAGGDGSGRFRIDAPRTSSSQYDNFCAVALAPGYGVGWVKLDPDAEQPIAEIALRPEQVIYGRLFDLQGRPARDVTVSVWSIGRIVAQEPDPVRSRFNRFDGISYFWTNLNVFPAWPKPATNRLRGPLHPRGVGRDLQAGLTVNDPRFARQRLEIETNSTSESKPLTMAVIPAQILTGRVTYADTGKPVPHAQLSVGASKGNMVTPIEFETDGEGRFRVNPSPGDGFSVSVLPPEGQPYLTAGKYLDWPKGAVEQSVDLALPRGVVIRGKVTEEGSGQPVAGAIVWYQGRRSTDELNPRVSKSRSGPDGSYQFAVRSGPGHLVIEGPSDDYVLREIGYRMLDQGEPGGRRRTHTPLSPATPNRVATAWRSTSGSAEAGPCRVGSSPRTGNRPRTPGYSAASSSIRFPDHGVFG